MLIYHVQPLTPGQHTPSCLIPLRNKSRTHKKKASCSTSPRGVAPKIHLPQNLHKLMKSRPALSLLVWLYVTRLTWPNKIFSPLTTPCYAYSTTTHIIYADIYIYIQNQIIKEIIIQTTKHKIPKLRPHTWNKYRPSAPHAMKKRIDFDSPADS